MARDRDEVAEHSLARELRPGTWPDDRDLADRARPAHHGIGGTVDPGQQVIGGNGLGLHPGGHRPGPLLTGPARPGLLRAGPLRTGELKRRDVPDPLPGRGRLVRLRAGYPRDATAGDLFQGELPAEDKRREDHHLRDGVPALDVRGGIRLGQAGPLRRGQCLLVGGAVGHLGQDRVGGGVQHAAQAEWDGTGQALGQRGQHRRPRHDRGLGAERHPAAAGERGQLGAVPGNRPLVGGDHRYAAPERLPHVAQAWLGI